MIGLRALVFLIAGSLLAGTERAAAQSFDGVTIVELADEAGENAILGSGRIGPADTGNFIVAFVSAQGSYATLVSARSDRRCVAWAVEGSYAGSSIDFGLPASAATMTAASPRICLPFTLAYEDAGTVRVTARNSFHKDQGPLSQAADVVSYSEPRKVVAHVPLVAFDWGSPIFEKHDVKGVKLGPLPAVEASLAGRASIKVGELRRQMEPRKAFEAAFEGQDGGSGARVLGHVAAKEILGWPWDALYGAWLSERTPPSTTEAFERAVFEKYGEESLAMQGKARLFWIYDLAGRRLTQKSAGPDNCRATADDWRGGSGLFLVNQDLGPWGCALIMMLTHNGGRGTVSEYRIEVVSGYALALNHFFARLEEMQEARRKIQKLESQKPKL